MEMIQAPTDTKAIKEHRCNFCYQKILTGSIYVKSVWKADSIYAWKTHNHCADIATKLKMYEDSDDGVDSDAFSEHIKNEYQNIIMQINPNAKDIVFPKFLERLYFVCKNYEIEIDNLTQKP